ncbi:MAG: hypothetical protein GX375_07390 [Clostridiales bacterium]|nr:hypothetical protein [Clostridiales bacterium]
MKYIILTPVLYAFIYLLSFTKYNWDNRNKMAAIGTVIIAIAALVMPFFIL